MISFVIMNHSSNMILYESEKILNKVKQTFPMNFLLT